MYSCCISTHTRIDVRMLPIQMNEHCVCACILHMQLKSGFRDKRHRALHYCEHEQFGLYLILYAVLTNAYDQGTCYLDWQCNLCAVRLHLYTLYIYFTIHVLEEERKAYIYIYIQEELYMCQLCKSCQLFRRQSPTLFAILYFHVLYIPT